MPECRRPPDVQDAADKAWEYRHDVPAAPFGTKAAAGVFSGRGVMVGSNPDVWDQVRGLPVDVVAVIPGTGADNFPLQRVVIWAPPQLEPCAANLHQAENTAEWAVVKDHPNLILNSWEYGPLPGKIILVECYWNEGWGVDFGIFRKYMDAGAKAVIPLLGGYVTAAYPDANATVQAQLCEWSKTYGPFPGIWWYAGESYLTPESVGVLKAWTQ